MIIQIANGQKLEGNTRLGGVQGVGGEMAIWEWEIPFSS